MSTEKYIILRSREVFSPTRGGMGMRSASTGVATMKMEEADLTKRERNDLRRDPRTRAIALPMPLKLIAPIKRQAADTVTPPSTDAITWGVKAVRAHESRFDGTGVTVAVLDSGIDPNHPAFAGVNLLQQNFTKEDPNDLDGHGTHCAGTIFGQEVNGTRIGIARRVERALIGKVLGEGGGTSATLAKAIQWALHEGAHVISMSVGIDFPGYVDWLVKNEKMHVNPATSMALEEYRANVNLFTELASFVQAYGSFGQGAIIVAASGNESMRPKYEISVAPPAAGTGIIAVGALGESTKGLVVAEFSNNQADIAAPGIDILSAEAGSSKLTSMDGTSMATPHAAGVAVLWAQRQLEMTGRVENPSLMAQLVASGSYANLAPGSEEDDVGTGIVQAPLN
ncbi:MAG: peptidase S8 [Thiothrix lacustris]|uniref:Peptidase S8 n=1 Tax=Thiothrix lacustris TaxID=525917 RepID=A0A1Y1QVU1_9GAMM|nr:MAG: peptidase S8 [Thiothrix lacustris]